MDVPTAKKDVRPGPRAASGTIEGQILSRTQALSQVAEAPPDVLCALEDLAFTFSSCFETCHARVGCARQPTCSSRVSFLAVWLPCMAVHEAIVLRRLHAFTSGCLHLSRLTDITRLPGPSCRRRTAAPSTWQLPRLLARPRSVHVHSAGKQSPRSRYILQPKAGPTRPRKSVKDLLPSPRNVINCRVPSTSFVTEQCGVRGGVEPVL